MQHLILNDSYAEEYPIILLQKVLIKDRIKGYYPDLPHDKTVVLPFPNTASINTATLRELFKEIIEVALRCKTRVIIITDVKLLKSITRISRSSETIGKFYTIDKKYPILATYMPSGEAIFYNPYPTTTNIKRASEAILSLLSGTYVEAGKDVIRSALYPNNIEAIATALDQLNYAELTCDIETYSLKPHLAGIASIGFAWDKHNGIAFKIDESKEIRNETVRELLKKFFIRYSGKLIFHNAAFDVSVLIQQLFMKSITDTEGLLEGLEAFNNIEDTKLIAYCVVNSAGGNKLGLKVLAAEFAGDYALEDISDVSVISKEVLLKYNLIDALSTYYVYETYYPKMVKENQLEVYRDLFIPSLYDVIQMQLTGLPLDMQRVIEAEGILKDKQQEYLRVIANSSVIKEFTEQLNEEWVIERNAVLKKKRVTIADAKEVFNPNSHKQLQKLLFNFLELPIIAYTDSKQPSTNKATLSSLVSHTTEPSVITLLEVLVGLADVEKILSAFIPAFKEAPECDGWHYLRGNFNLGGTVSGRMSSNNPNLQQIPSNSFYGKLIKSCFRAPKGYLLVGLDFSSLEDRISALITKDANKLKVYTDGFDGHCLRACYYFRDQLPDIDLDEPDSVNAIAKTHKHLRQASKAPTFLLTYGGTYHGLMKNCGFSEQDAKTIEQRYHEMYHESDRWVGNRLAQAAKDGYITVAFGLRLRTPILHQTILNTSVTPKLAEEEARTAGNALGQSWGLLNNRAMSETMHRVRSSSYASQIRPCAAIHDAQYYLIPNSAEAVIQLNKWIVEAVNWQEHPDIQHDQVKLGGELSIFYPTWAEELVVNNEETTESLIERVNEYKKSVV